ncbi:zinc ribbon domain-containing protein [Gemmatimonadota bacterium]
MPIYEYLCPECNVVFSFMVKNVKTAKRAYCPRCGNKKTMERVMSNFAFAGPTRKSTGDGSDGAVPGGGSGADDMPDLSPGQEREMMRLMSQVEGMDENDPKQMGTLMRKMSEITGEGLDPQMEEAVRRLEAGEDPDKIEEDLGDLGMGDGGGMGGPSYDDGMYSL